MDGSAIRARKKLSKSKTMVAVGRYFGKSPLNRQLQFKARQHTENIKWTHRDRNIFGTEFKGNTVREVAHRDWNGSACLRVKLKIMTLLYERCFTIFLSLFNVASGY